MNVRGVAIKDMIWMENSEFQDDLYWVIFMGIKKKNPREYYTVLLDLGTKYVSWTRKIHLNSKIMLLLAKK